MGVQALATWRTKVASGVGVALVLGVLALVTGFGPSVQADTRAYELFCPGTPVGDIVLNDVVTSGDISPPDPNAGQAFSLTNYQTTLVLPNAIAAAALALGNTDLPGTLSSVIDAQGASPSSISAGTVHFDAPIPSPVPESGMVISVPAHPVAIGPFTASGSDIVISQDKSVSLSLTVSGSTLALHCRTFRNHSLASGISNSRPYGGSVSPVIASDMVPPVVTTSSLSGAKVGQTYAARLAATGGNPPYIWKVAPGSARLPKGLRLVRKPGDIVGTPNRLDHGTYSFTVEVLDKRVTTHPRVRDSATKVLTITVS
jgi:hypothetical protein